MMEIKTIKDIAKFIRTGKTPPTQEVKYFDGEVNWYTPGDLDKGKYLSTSKRTLTNLAFEEKKAVVFPKNTLIVGCIGDIGKLGITVDDCSSNQQLTGIYPNDNVDVNYLYYWFKGNKSLIDSYANNAVVPILNNRTLETIKLPIPPLPQQQKIANILDAADALRQNDKALIAKYDELTQALFLDMFGDPVSNPKGWEKIRFDELVSKDCPLTYGIVQPGEEFDNGVPCVRPVDLVSQYIKIDNLKKIDPIISSKFKRTLLKGGELLLSVRGSVGVISIADDSIKGSNVTRGIVPIWFDSNVSNKLFFYYLYNTKEIQREIKSLARGATLIQINLKDLREIEIIKPNLSLQNQFAERVAVIEEQKAIAQKSIEKSESLFNSLLQKAFKGELV
jgi:type I restriction enzyme S subunit